MKKIVFANQKGGVGKSAIALHQAFFLHEKGYKVLFVDLDTQANSSYTLRKQSFSCGDASKLYGGDHGLANVNAKKNSITFFSGDHGLANVETKGISLVGEDFKRAVDILAAKFDVCIFDTPPAVGVKLTSALLVADYLFCPIEPEAYSIQGVQLMVSTYLHIKERLNKDLNFGGIIISRLDSRSPRQRKNVELIQKTYNEYTLKEYIGLRSSVADSLSEGRPVWRIKKSSARLAGKEFLALCGVIEKKVFGGNK